jgi:hypothetical protein
MVKKMFKKKVKIMSKNCKIAKKCQKKLSQIIEKLTNICSLYEKGWKNEDAEEKPKEIQKGQEERRRRRKKVVKKFS